MEQSKTERPASLEPVISPKRFALSKKILTELQASRPDSQRITQGMPTCSYNTDSSSPCTTCCA